MVDFDNTDDRVRNHAEKRNEVLLKLQEICKRNTFQHSSHSDSSARRATEKYGEQSSPIVEDLLIEMNRKRFKYDSSNTDCYRCKHFLNVPLNVSEKISDYTEECEADLSFVQAIVWLKSAITFMKDVSIEQLHLLFHKQWNDTHQRKDCEYFDQDSVLDSQRHYCDSFNSPVVFSMNKESSTASDGQTEYTSSIDLLYSVQNQINSNTLESHNNEVCSQSKCTPSLFNSQSPARGFDDFTKNNATLENYIIPETDKEYSSSSDIFRDSSGSSESNTKWDKNFNEIVKENALIFDRSPEEFFLMSEKNNFTPRSDFIEFEEGDDSSSTSSDMTVFHEENTICKQIKYQPQNNEYRQISESLKNVSKRNKQEINFDIREKNVASRNQKDIMKCSQKDSIYETYQSSLDHSSSSICIFQNEDIDTLTTRENLVITPYRKDDSAYETRDWQSESFSSKIHSYEKYNRSTDTIKGEKSSQELIEEWNCKGDFRQKRSLESIDKIELNTKKSAEKISSQWLKFTLDSLSVDDIALQSVRVILSVLQNERVTRQYMKRRCWRSTLEKEAVDAILNFCEVYEAENKTNACTQEIVQVVTSTLDKNIENTESNKVAYSIHQVSITLELCCSMKVCIEIVNYLTAKLKSRGSDLISITNGKKAQLCHIVNGLHVLLYALNICLSKYRLVFPNKGENEFEENTIVPVIDLWKRQLIVEGVLVQDSARAREQRWLLILDEFTVIAAENFVQFAEKSRRLVNLLNCE